MAEPRRGIGRGLAAILPPVDRDGARDELREIAIELIAPNPRQPRGRFDQDELATLAESIKANGVLQPLLVRAVAGGRYELVAGERRLRASALAGLTVVPAVVRGDLEAHALELALIENMARSDLNPIEEARACAALVDELGLSKEEVGRRVGRSRVAVSNLIRLLNLPDDVIDLVEEGKLSEGHGRALLRATDHATRRSLARRAIDENWSVRETEAWAVAGTRPNVEGNSSRESSGLETIDPDLESLRQTAEDELGRILGLDVTVKMPLPRSSSAASVTIGVEDAEALRDLVSTITRLG